MKMHPNKNAQPAKMEKRIGSLSISQSRAILTCSKSQACGEKMPVMTPRTPLDILMEEHLLRRQAGLPSESPIDYAARIAEDAYWELRDNADEPCFNEEGEQE